MPPSTSAQSPSDRQTLLEVRNLAKSYGNHEVLKDINLSVDQGEVLALIGPSGSGKSTLLRCLNHLESPTRGIIRVSDLTLDAAKPLSAQDLARLRRKAGMVFQSFNLFPHMSVLKNIALPQQRVLGRSKDEAEARAISLLKRVGLEDKAQQYPARCSGGQQQRIAIARALALDPEIMLFDEPTSALDPEIGLEVLAVMQELAEAGMTMIVVTHEMHFAETVSDRVMLMADGHVLEEGPSAQVMRHPQSERAQRFLKAVMDR